MKSRHCSLSTLRACSGHAGSPAIGNTPFGTTTIWRLMSITFTSIPSSMGMWGRLKIGPIRHGINTSGILVGNGRRKSRSFRLGNHDGGISSRPTRRGAPHSEFHDVNNSRNIVNKLPKFMFMEAEPVVEGALRAVENGHVVFVPGVWNKFVVWLAKALPRPWAAAMVRGQSRKFRRRPR